MQRHRFHSLCPYFAMFPENFVRKHIFAFTQPGDLVFDPFSGRGTTVLESLLNDRAALGSDINPVAVCVSGAKAAPPKVKTVLERLRQLESEQNSTEVFVPDCEFFKKCFHHETMQQLSYLRSTVKWQKRHDDRFIAALILGCLQGDPSRTKHCLSNRMPRTICTKPDYSVRWWDKHNLFPPKRDVFEIVRYMINYRFGSTPAKRRGTVRKTDVRRANSTFSRFKGKVNLVITSPPYFDTTNCQEDQWLRMWFLGGHSIPNRTGGDDRHTSIDRYWQFLEEAWKGTKELLATDATIVVRLGGKGIDKGELGERLISSLSKGLKREIKLLGNPVTSSINRPQTLSFRPGIEGTGVEHDFCVRLD